MLKKVLKRLKNRRGSAEILSFCVMCPFVLYLILVSLNVFAYIRAGQIAEYCAYVGGRAAVVTTQDIGADTDHRLAAAQGAANAVVEQTMAVDGYRQSASADLEAKQWHGELRLVESDSAWTKGVLAEYTVTMRTVSFIGTTPRTVQAAIVMMVETPVDSGNGVIKAG